MVNSRCMKPPRIVMVALSLLAGFLLQACTSGDMGDLESYIRKVNARQSKKIEPIPPPATPEIYKYSSAERVNPFEPFVTEEPELEVNSALAGKIESEKGRIKEELEFFPLDALRLVGTLEQNQNTWALVTAPDGAVHRVEVGNYMGRNYGKVQLVAEDHVELIEIVPDSLGSWQERPARLDLAE